MHKDKFQKLFKIMPFGAVVTSKWLNEKGYTASDLQQYTRNKWIESLGYGAYKRHDCEIDRLGLIHGLQQYKVGQFWVGGRSALEIVGAAHYVRNVEKADTYLYTSENQLVFPKWFKNYQKYHWKLVRSSLIKNMIGIEEYDASYFTVMISSRERALLEFINNVSKTNSFSEANYLVENSSSFRPDLLQTLLECCNSVKTKRIILFLGEKNNMNWFNEIDFSKIDLGNGDREVIKNGIFDKKYKITYPRGLFEDDSQKF